jgi:DNA-binding Xre family transcriptional regulator
MLTLNLAPIFRIRGIEKPFTYLVQNGFSRHAATLLINAKNRVYRLDHMERLCELLVCEPNDLLAWTPNHKQEYPENFPLLKLKHQETSNIKDTLIKTPLSELKILTESIVNGRNS